MKTSPWPNLTPETSKKLNTKSKTTPKSINFIIEPPKRVLPKDSHYFLLDPIKTPSKAPVLTFPWPYLSPETFKHNEHKQERTPKVFYEFSNRTPKTSFT